MHTATASAPNIIGIADQLLNVFEAAEFVRNSLGIPINDSTLSDMLEPATGRSFASGESSGSIGKPI